MNNLNSILFYERLEIGSKLLFFIILKLGGYYYANEFIDNCKKIETPTW